MVEADKPKAPQDQSTTDHINGQVRYYEWTDEMTESAE